MGSTKRHRKAEQGIYPLWHILFKENCLFPAKYQKVQLAPHSFFHGEH